MFKKFLSAVLCVLPIMLEGCSPSKQIDTAALAETVSADYIDGELVYTFYILDSGDEVNSVSVSAPSFREAYNLAKKSYIPNLSLSKFELFLVNENIYKSTLKTDMDYISTQYFMSPLSYVALCDSKTIEFLSQSKDAPKELEKHILLLKNKNSDVLINFLSVFNACGNNERNNIYIPCFNSAVELKAERYKINPEK